MGFNQSREMSCLFTNRESGLPTTLIGLEQRFPTGGSRSPGVRKAIFESESFYVLGCTFFSKERGFMKESLQVLLLKKTSTSQMILDKVTNLTI